MTTTEPDTVAGILAGPDPTDVDGARALVDALVDAGLPTPLWRPTIRDERDTTGDVALSLVLATTEHLAAWAVHVDTLDALADVARGEPWSVGGAAYDVVVGRLAGLRTVLATEHEDPATGDLPRDELTRAILDAEDLTRDVADERDVAAPPSETRPRVESPVTVPTLHAVEGILALVVPVDGDVREVVLRDTGDHHLAELRRHTGSGWIEHVRGPWAEGPTSLWVDEEGAVVDPPRSPNARIDRLLARSDGWSIRGDVVITGAAVWPDGEATSLSLQTVTALREFFASVTS